MHDEHLVYMIMLPPVLCKVGALQASLTEHIRFNPLRLAMLTIAHATGPSWVKYLFDYIVYQTPACDAPHIFMHWHSACTSSTFYQ
jgi:hypothetical protein